MGSKRNINPPNFSTCLSGLKSLEWFYPSPGCNSITQRSPSPSPLPPPSPPTPLINLSYENISCLSASSILVQSPGSNKPSLNPNAHGRASHHLTQRDAIGRRRKTCFDSGRGPPASWRDLRRRDREAREAQGKKKEKKMFPSPPPDCREEGK